MKRSDQPLEELQGLCIISVTGTFLGGLSAASSVLTALLLPTLL